jgi:hypothetical protein
MKWRKWAEKCRFGGPRATSQTPPIPFRTVSGREILGTSHVRRSLKSALELCPEGYRGSGSPQLVQEGARPPEALGEHRRILPYAYAQVVLEAERRPRREHHATFFGEPVGEL